jgi:phosphate transport system protein
MATHTDRNYEAQLDELRQRLMRMAAIVEAMIESSMRALLQGNVDLAKETIRRDRSVNRLELEADELCTEILARWQPVASDLRFVTIALKMVTDLERIGDLAVNICERVQDMAGHEQPWDFRDIDRMAHVVREMIHDAIEAFVASDADLAQKVIDRDEEVDELYHTLFRALVATMKEDPGTLVRDGIHVLSIAKWVERMADHSTNLAEQVVFMVKGKDVRHIGKLPDSGTRDSRKP